MASSRLGGRYRLEQQLSSTQMADVWLAHDPVLERRVVVKILAPAADRLRFEREARAVAALTHPNIVQLYDYGDEGGRPYMVLEHMPGGTLTDRLPEAKPLPDPETRLIATDIAGGLAYAHQHGVVHRDLKPGNVLFDAEDRAKIADFGIARVQGIDTLTEEGTVLGTAAYMSPEQVSGEPATAASDVYAFGILLYRMLLGRLPFESPNALELAAMQRDVEAAPVRSIRSDAPADLAALATAALAKEPARRPADGSALLAELQAPEPPTVVADASDAPTRLIPVPPPAPPRPPPARRLWPALVVAGVLLAAAGIAVAVLVFGSPSSSPADTTTGPLTAGHPPTTTHAATTTPTSVPTTTAPTSVPTTTAPATTTSPTTATRPTTSTSPPTTTPPPPTTTAATTTSSETTTAPATTSQTTTTTADGTTTGP